MNKNLNQIYNNEGYYGNVKSTVEGDDAPADEGGEVAARRNGAGAFFKSSGAASKADCKPLSKENEVYYTFQALLLAFSILVLSYNGARYGRSEYSLLENGQTVNGFVAPNRAVVTLSLGYSAPYSIVSSIAASMLLYSLISKKPRWSLPTLVLCMADLVCDMGDAVVASWLFFGSLRLTTAVLYTTGTIFIIMGELWIWLGVLQLYEFRTFH